MRRCEYCKCNFLGSELIVVRTRPDNDCTSEACKKCVETNGGGLRKWSITMFFKCTETPVERTEEEARKTALTWALDTGAMELVATSVEDLGPNVLTIDREWRLKRIRKLMGNDIVASDLGGM